MDMPSISRARALGYAVAVLVALLLGARLLHVGARPQAAPTGESQALALEAETTSAPKLVVHVVGAVAQPGLYRLKEGSRIDDAIRRAGGATGKAALELVNLAAPVADGQQVVVPKAGEAPPIASGGVPGAPAGRVHLNTATLEQLDALPGIGPVTAQGILDYRTEKGAFQSVEELDAVPGIGPARLEQLKELVDL
jgi:competence protein ComEA